MTAFHSAAGCRLAATLALIVAAHPSLARPDASRGEADEGVFLGPGYRWGEMPLAKRVLRDVVAIPANVGRWRGADCLQAALIGGAVGALWLGSDPSADVQIDRWTRAHLNPHLPRLWTPEVEVFVWTTLFGGGLGVWAWATTHERPGLAQGLSLMAESVAVLHAYHVTLKLLIGREGPEHGGEGRVLGPFRGLREFPSGTPSGHAGTLYAGLGAAFAYSAPPAWIQVLGHLAAGALTAFNVVDHGHFASEAVWGAAMGWYIGRWVVAHRASGRAPGAGARIAPVPLERGLGLALVGAF